MDHRQEKLQYVATLLLWAGILFGLACFAMALKGSING